MTGLDLRTAASALGGDISGRNGIVAPGPNHGPRDRSLSVLLDPAAPDGFTVYSHAGDDWRACRDHVAERLGLEGFRPHGRAQHTRPAPRPMPTPTPPDDRSADARRLWMRCSPAEGTAAQTYLEQRGYRGPIPGTIRYAPAGIAGAHHALVAACGAAAEIGDGLEIADADVQAVIRIYLAADGLGKAPVEAAKRTLGRLKGSPCWLRPVNDGFALALAEGLEDALSLAAPLGIGAMACGGAGFLEAAAATIPAYVEVLLLGEDDNDAGRRGCDAAEAIIRARTDWLAGRPPEIRRVKIWKGGAE